MSNIWRSKSNQKKKIGHVSEYNTRKIFLKKHTQNMMEKLFPSSFWKHQNAAYVWINSLNCITICFYYMSSWGLSKYHETELQANCFYFIQSFLKNKKRSELVPMTHFLHDLIGKLLLLLYSIINLIVWCLLFCEILGNMCMVIVC